ncbi:MAG: NAD(P)/FAD-dependent oxidoreductase [Alphaproteobacteria bacterium]|nr:NAD(P)/FAD-dependent oxidoreductase [Alphaproteobacteria bacterium]
MHDNIQQKHHIIVIGAGFAGLQLVRDLHHKNARITLIDQRNHHLFQPLLYQVATTILPTSEIAWPIRRILRSRKDITTLMATVSNDNHQQNKVHFADGGSLSYDTLIIATGARHSYFGHDEWEKHAPGLKTLEDATTIRRRILKAFELAEREADANKRQALLTFAVIGAGPTGVELVGIIAELAQKVLPQEFRNINTQEAKVLLVEAAPKILSVFPKKSSNYAKKALESLGVTVMTGCLVTECTANNITMNNNRTPCHTIIWAAGVKASPAAQWLNVDAYRAGRAIVQNDLSLKQYINIFVIGDTAAISLPQGGFVPGLAPAAKQQGAYIAKLLHNRLNGNQNSKPFYYKHQGNLATIGKRAAIADFGRIQFKGRLAWWVWGLAHIYFLIGTRSRISVAWSWILSYVSGQNSARLITQNEPENKK